MKTLSFSNTKAWTFFGFCYVVFRLIGKSHQEAKASVGKYVARRRLLNAEEVAS